MEAILSSPSSRVQAFLAAGHVCTVMGYEQYIPLADRYTVPIVVTASEPLDILQGIFMTVRQLEEGRAEVENQYARSVRRPAYTCTAGSYAVIAGSTVTNTGSSTISGNLGVSPGSAVTGFPPGIVSNGIIHAADANAGQAQNDVTNAYDILDSAPCDHDLTGQDLGGMTLTGGVYCFSSSAQLTGQLTLNAQGNASTVFIFQVGSTLTTASNSSVLITNGGLDCNVFWEVGSSATIGTSTTFRGNILALTSITLTTGANVSGRALARNGAVTLDTNHVGFEACAASTATASPTAAPTASATVTPSPSPTATAAPTGTATATATSPAAATPTPTATPVGRTPTPTATLIGQTPTPHITPCCLPRTGGPPLETSGFWWPLSLVALVMGTLGAVVLVLSFMVLNAQTHSRRE